MFILDHMQKELMLKEIGNRIRARRKKIGLSQEQLANHLEMQLKYCSSIECGKVNISIGNLSKICKGLDISLSQLLKNLDT